MIHTCRLQNTGNIGIKVRVKMQRLNLIQQSIIHLCSETFLKGDCVITNRCDLDEKI